MEQTRKPTSPGEIIIAHYLDPLDLSVKELAIGMDISPDILAALIEGRRAVDVEMAMRLSRVLMTSPEL